MPTPPHRLWWRLCVDLDVAGGPIGTSYEVHGDEGVEAFGTGPLPDPFDSPLEALDHLIEYVGSQYPLQVPLW